MKSIASVQFMFRHGALFNLGAGILLIVAAHSETVATLIGLPGVPVDQWAVHFTAMAVLVFGWMYWTIGSDPERNRAMIQFGIAGKSLTVILIYTHWLIGDVGWRLPAIATGDAIYTVLFLSALRRLDARA